MFDYKAHGVSPKSTALLQTYAEQIAALDHDKPLSLIDLGRILTEPDRKPMKPW